MADNREWVNNRYLPNGTLCPVYFQGIKEFIERAFLDERNKKVINNKECVKCPCRECHNRFYQNMDDLSIHLIKKGGMMRDYKVWVEHGETPVGREEVNLNEQEMGDPEQMAYDAAGLDFNREEGSPSQENQEYLDLLNSATEKLWVLEEAECSRETILSAVSLMLNLKSECEMSEVCYNRMTGIIKKFLPRNNKLPRNYYESKKLVKKLGMGYQNIHCCPNNCMLYYGEDESSIRCNKCGESRYKKYQPVGLSRKTLTIPQKVVKYLPITSRLQRLYTSPRTAEHMTWHKVRTLSDKMIHPADGEDWKNFDAIHPEFASEPRNVRLGLSTDGFTPFNQNASPYSCWPVLLVPYNLPPGMSFKKDNMFLSLVIPGPKHPGNLNIFLRPLIDELKKLWDTGVVTFDSFRRRNFTMRAALMWTINDFPAYGMVSGWSTHGKLACPICMENTKAFWLPKGKKNCWFDCHRQFLPENHKFRRNRQKFLKNKIVKDIGPSRRSGDEMRVEAEMIGDIPRSTNRAGKEKLEGYGTDHHWTFKSIFWDLPYWSTNMVRYNLDVMHIEKNIFENIFNMVMDIPNKTKDNPQSRMDLAQFCDRPELELQFRTNGSILKPKAKYALGKEDKILVFQWLKDLRFPDGYAANWTRCVKLPECRVQGLKSHDGHIFMQRLLPVAFRDVLPNEVWEPLTELSNFFRDLCATELDPKRLEEMEQNIIITLCKLEQIFPPSFFDSMEHLIMHLPYEARVGGPVSFRWMYPFERGLRKLKDSIRNRARVEGSIVATYIIDEISSFCSHYLAADVHTRHNRPSRHDEGGETSNPNNINIFNFPGRGFLPYSGRVLSDVEVRAAHYFVLMNCALVDDYVRDYDLETMQLIPNLSDEALASRREEEFADWFEGKVKYDTNISDEIRNLAVKPSASVNAYRGYYCNGYKFHTESRSAQVKTANDGVCVKGAQYEDVEFDYYGILEDIVELSYSYTRTDKVILFKCRWFDPKKGVKEDKVHGLVEVRNNTWLRTYEPFVFAHQTSQVYYLSYPSKKRRDWRVAVKCSRKFSLENTLPLNRSSDPMSDPLQDDGVDTLPYSVTEEDELEFRLNTEGAFDTVDEIINLDNANEEDDEEEEEEDDDEEEEEDEDDEEEEYEDDEEEREDDDDDDDHDQEDQEEEDHENSENSDF